MKLDRPLPLAPLLFRHLGVGFRLNLASLEAMRVMGPDGRIALLAQVEVGTLLTIIPEAAIDLVAAVRTGREKLRHVWIVDVVERHHRRMLRTS